MKKHFKYENGANMEIFLLIIMFLILVYVIARKPEAIGTIVITDDDYMYVELKDNAAIDKIKTSKRVIFDISHE